MVRGDRGRPMLPTSATPGIAAAVSLAVLGAFACARASDEARHGAGARPARIVTIGGPVTEAVFALGAGGRVIAVDVTSTYPAAVAALPKVGYQRALSAEGLLALDPELVVASADAGPPATIEALRAAGVRVELLPPADTVVSAADRIRAIGRAIGEPGPADGLAERARGRQRGSGRGGGGARRGACCFCTRAVPAHRWSAGRDTAAAAMLGAGRCDPGDHGVVGLSAAHCGGHRRRSPRRHRRTGAGPRAPRRHRWRAGVARHGRDPGRSGASGWWPSTTSCSSGFGPRLPEAIATLDGALAGAP
jgi:ABC-type hemin transport system substrate-binding protein